MRASGKEGAGMVMRHPNRPSDSFLSCSVPETFGTLFPNIAEWAKGSGRWATNDMDSIPQLIARKDLTMMGVLSLDE